MAGCDCSTGTIWYHWTNAANVTTTSSCGQMAWTNWTSGTCTASSTTCSGIWYNWIGGTATTGELVEDSAAGYVWTQWNLSNGMNDFHAVSAPVSVPDPTPAQLAERARRAEEQAKKAEERARKAEEARERAEELLRQLLDEQQRQEYDQDKSFHVVGADGERYRVRHNWAGHVDRVDAEGRPVERFCIHPEQQVPLADNQLIAKLMLEVEPERFRQIANMTRLIG